MKLATNTRKGMSLPELIAVIIVIAIIGGIALNVISGLSAEAKDSKGLANASEINRLVSLAKAGGVTVSAGGTIDTTSPATLIADLQTGVTIPGSDIALKLDGNPTAASYTLSGDVISFTLGSEP